MIVLAFVVMSLFDPAVAYDNTKVACHADTECGKGDCWVGQCEPSGFCMAYYTCV